MDLKTVFSSISQKVGSKKENSEEFLAVKISSTEVSAATWQVAQERVELGKVTQAEVRSEKFEDLLSAADEAVSQAIDSEKNQSPETEKAIFGLPFHWVAEGKIVEEKLALLRRLCQELDLKPLGFVLLSEALENYYKEIDGAPLTAILLEIDGKDGLLTMYRAGKNLGTVPLNGETEQVNEGLEKALKKFTQAEVLPSRIIVYDGKEKLEAIADKITAFPWTKNLPFLHFPKVEVLPSNQMVKAIAVAGGMQMGGHFESEGVITEEEKSNEEEKIELEEVSAEEAGFLPETEFEEVKIPLGASSLGRLQEIQTLPVKSGPSAPDGDSRDLLSVIRGELLGFGKNFLAGAKKLSSVSKILSFLFSSPLNGGAHPKLSTIVPVIFLTLSIVSVLVGGVIYSLPKVTVLLRVSSPTFDKELTITVVTEGSTAPATNSAETVSGSFIKVSEIGTKKGVATGRQLVGDRAKGTVTIYSATAERTFAAGTAIFSPSGLKFTLDNDATVASGDAITHATATSTITAFDIGDSYNLPTGTKFTIGGLSSSQYAAQTDKGLSGGNSHQATVVAKEDQNRLMATLSAELTQKAKGDLEAKLSPGQKLLPNAVTSVVSKKKFSQDVGNEADTVSLDLTMDFSGVIFSQSDLVAVFARSFPEDIPAGFILSPDRASVDIKEVKTDKSGNALLRVHLNSGLLPEIDSEDIVKNVSGKTPSAAKAYLGRIPGISSLSLETSPKILEPVTNFFLPWKKENIKIEVVSE